MRNRAILASLKGCGRIIRKLIETHTPEQMVQELTADEMHSLGFREEMIQRFFSELQESNAETLIASLEACDAHILMPCDPEYPLLLRQSSAHPLFLYRRGKYVSDETTLAIVGSRAMTRYGSSVTEALTSELTAAGCTIVSGLAYGVDACAHEVTIKAGGRAIAVLGSGIDQIYPRAHERLAQMILESGGTIYSEYPPGLKPEHFTFPARNRIISGLSQGVLVTQAREKSGALITADFALQDGREVFAVPADIFDPRSQGTNQLIAQGAHVVISASDILKVFGMASLRSFQNASEIYLNLSDDEMRCIELLKNGELQISHMPQKLNWNMKQISTILTLLEMKGHVEREGEMVYLQNQKKTCNVATF